MKKKRSAVDSYVRTPDYASRLTGVHFPPEVWAVFAHTETPVATDELARRLRLPLEEVLSAIRRLARRKLVQKHLLGWEAYAGAHGLAPAAPVSSSPAAIQLTAPTPAPAAAASTLHTVAQAPMAAAMPPPVAAPSLSPATLPETPLRDLTLSPTVSLRIAHPGLSALREPEGLVSCSFGRRQQSRTWRLRPIIDSIAEKGGGGVPGQLLVYRVFLRVPTALMESSKVSSLTAVDEAFEVSDVRLIDAISKAAREIASLELEALAA